MFSFPRHLDVNRVSAENRWVGNTTAESLASSTKVGDDVSGIMLGAYARARHAVRRAGRGASVGEGLPARVTSEPCRTGRYCADACAARVGRLLRACRAKQPPRVLAHSRQRMRTNSSIGEASVLPSQPLAGRVVPRGRTPRPMPILIVPAPPSRGLERAKVPAEPPRNRRVMVEGMKRRDRRVQP